MNSCDELAVGVGLRGHAHVWAGAPEDERLEGAADTGEEAAGGVGGPGLELAAAGAAAALEGEVGFEGLEDGFDGVVGLAGADALELFFEGAGRDVEDGSVDFFGFAGDGARAYEGVEGFEGDGGVAFGFPDVVAEPV